MASARLDTPDVTRSGTPGARRDHRAGRVSRNAWVARQKEGCGQGSQATRWFVRRGGLLVAGSRSRCAAHGPHTDVEAMD